MADMIMNKKLSATSAPQTLLPADTSYAIAVTRPSVLAAWDTSAHVAGVSFGPAAGLGGEAAARGVDTRNRFALQGSAPPRENPR